MFIHTVFVPFILLSYCYLVTFFFIRIIHEKFKLTSHADSCSVATKKKSYFVVLAPYMSYYYLTTIEKEPSPNEKFLIHAPCNKNRHEFRTFYIRPHSGTDLAQWDWGIMEPHLEHRMAHCSEAFQFITKSVEESNSTIPYFSSFKK